VSETVAIAECSACGRRSFPAQAFGCEACGAGPERLRSLDVPADGRIVASAVVHRHRGPDWPGVPFALGEVALDAGPTVTAVVTGEAGARVVGEAVDRHLRFVAAP
jgi:uncharacterized OB-fold protein